MQHNNVLEPYKGRDSLSPCTAVLPPLTQSGRPGLSSNFRDSITRLWHSLHTLRAPLAGALRNVRFRVAANLSRAGVISRWVSTACFIFIYSFSVPHALVRWRNVYLRGLEGHRASTWLHPEFQTTEVGVEASCPVKLSVSISVHQWLKIKSQHFAAYNG